MTTEILAPTTQSIYETTIHQTRCLSSHLYHRTYMDTKNPEVVKEVEKSLHIGASEIIRQAHEYFNRRTPTNQMAITIDLYWRYGVVDEWTREYCHLLQTKVLKL